MKILKKAVALLLTALLAFSSLTVLASAGPAGTNLTIDIKLLRYDGSSWVEVGPDNKVIPGEAVRARVYVGTDYPTSSSRFLFFYDSNFFEDNYAFGSTTSITVNNSVYGASTADAMHLPESGINALITNGNILATQKTDPRSDILVDFLFPGTRGDAPISASDWMFELQLTVKNSATMDSEGAIYVVPETICNTSTLGQTALVDVPKGTPGNLLDTGRVSMYTWDADAQLLNTPFGGANDSNWATINSSIIFDANGGIFPDSSVTSTYTGVTGSLLDFTTTVTQPTRANMDFVGWYPSTFVGTPTAADCVTNSFFTYGVQTFNALWTNSMTQVTFDANGGPDALFSNYQTTNTVSTDVGIPYTPPTNPNWTGHDFQGWWTMDGSINDDYGTQITSFVGPSTPVTYYAKWNPRTGTNYRIVCHYIDPLSGIATSYTINEYGITDDWVYIVDTAPVPAPNTVYHAYADINAQLSAIHQVVDQTDNRNELSGRIAGNGSLELDLYCIPVNHTATFDPAGGTFSGYAAGASYTTTQPFGEFIAGPPAVTLQHFTLNGWTPAFTNGETRMLADRTYVAQWTAIEYDADFYLDAADVGNIAMRYDSYDEPFGATIQNPPVPMRNGFTFVGWSTDGSTVLSNLVMDSEGKTFIAVWAPALMLTATFDANGGAFADSTTTKSAQYSEGILIANPGAVTRAGYTFLRWLDTSSNTEYVPGVTQMGNTSVTYTAQWAANVNVTYIVNGTTYQQFNTYEGATPLPVPAINPVVVGNTFTGWQTSGGNVPGDYTSVPVGGATFTAQLTPNPTLYNVSYAYVGVVPSGAPAVPTDTSTYLEGANVNVAPVPTLTDYTFSGWYYNGTLATSFNMPSANVTLTGTWTAVNPVEYTITYYYAAGNIYVTDTFAPGEAIIIPAPPTMTGMTFSGWTTDPTGQTVIPLPTTMPANPVNVYAMWTTNLYDVTYVVEGVTYQSYPDVPYGSQITVPTDPTRAGYVFAGWSPAIPASMPAQDMIFTALWTTEPGPGEYTVTYMSACNNTYRAYTVAEGAAVPIPEENPTLFGHTFVGWEPEVPAVMPAENLVFEAQWEVDDTFVAIVIGGTIIAGGAIATAAAIGTGITVSVIGGAIVIGLIAHAIGDTYTVTYLVDGNVYKTYKVLAGTRIPVPDEPTKSGYEFKKWNPDVPERMPENDLTFEAKWSQVGAGNSTDDEIPQTGSAAGGITVFAFICAAAAAAYVTLNKKNANA